VVRGHEELGGREGYPERTGRSVVPYHL